jgi:hypothetical protein
MTAEVVQLPTQRALVDAVWASISNSDRWNAHRVLQTFDYIPMSDLQLLSPPERERQLVSQDLQHMRLIADALDRPDLTQLSAREACLVKTRLDEWYLAGRPNFNLDRMVVEFTPLDKEGRRFRCIVSMALMDSLDEGRNDVSHQGREEQFVRLRQVIMQRALKKLLEQNPSDTNREIMLS